MNGKIVAGFVVASGLIAGIAIYYLQVYGYYTRLDPTGAGDVTLVAQATDTAEPIEYDAFQAIDATSSPIRYRACFTTTTPLEVLSKTYQPAEDATPRNGPGWFDCYDAAVIGAALEEGSAKAFIGAKNVEYGVDRIVAITENGRGYVWHDLNNCGEKAYDGTVVGEDCPPRPGTN